MATFAQVKDKDPRTETYLAKVAKAESGNNPNAKNPYGSATGLFQFTSDTWKGMTKKYGLDYTLEDRKNPEKAANVMRKFTQENENQIKGVVGRELNDGDRYMAHFLGAGGARKFFSAYNTNPNMSISAVMNQQALNANKGVVYDNSGRLKSVAEVYGWATSKMGGNPQAINYEGQSSESSYKQYEDVIPDFDSYIKGGGRNIESSTTEYIEEQDNSEVEAAKRDISEKSFMEEMQNTIKGQQEQISQMQQAMQPQEQQGEPQQEEYVFDQMPDPYNYININEGQEEYQDGGEVDRWGSPIIAKQKDFDGDRSYYDPRTNRMMLGNDYRDISEDDQQNLKSHENRHAWQFQNERSNFNITHKAPEDNFQDRLQKKPPMMATDEEYWKYHNRKEQENNIVVGSMMKNFPDLRFMNREFVFDKTVDDLQYTEPMSMEGEATYYEETGEDYFKDNEFQDGGTNRRVQRENNPERLKNESTEDYKKRQEYFAFKIKQKQNENPVKKVWNQIEDDQNNSPSSLLTTARKVLTSPIALASSLHNLMDTNDTENLKSFKYKRDEVIDTAANAADAAALLVPFSGGMKYTGIPLRDQIIKRGAFNFIEDEAINVAKSFEEGGIVDPMGQWAHPGEVTIIPGNDITMQGVDYPVLGIDNLGNEQMMQPGEDYKFEGDYVTEYPQMQDGGNFFGGLNYGEKEMYPKELVDFEKVIQDNPGLKEGQGVVVDDTFVSPDNSLDEVVIRRPGKVSSKEIRRFLKAEPDFSNQRDKVIKANDTIKDTFLDSSITNFKKEEVINEEVKNKKLTFVKPEDLKYKQKLNEVERADIEYTDFDNLSQEEQQEISKNILTDKGYIKQEPTNKQEVVQLQNILKDYGYDLGGYGLAKDGVDGQYGSKTKKALNDYNNAQIVDRREDVKAILKGREESTFIQKTNENSDFFYLKDDADIKNFQDSYRKKGFFKEKIENYNTRIKGDDLEKGSKFFNSDFNKIYEDQKSCYGEECASFVTSDILSNLKSHYGAEAGAKLFDESQVRGNAWTMNSNIVKSGGATIYNVFDGKPKTKDPKEIKKFVESRINSAPSLKSGDVKSGDIIHMYYSGSSKFGQAAEEGDDVFSTHVGIIKKDSKGKTFVEHNVHGEIQHTNIEDLISKKYAKSGSKNQIAITGVSRPKYNMNKDDKGVEEVKYLKTSSVNTLNTDYIKNRNSPFLKNVLPVAQETLAANKDKLVRDLPINSSEFDKLEKGIVSIMWKESSGNTNIDNPNDALSNGKVARGVKKASARVLDRFGREMSKGLTQMKDNKNLSSEINKNILGEDSNLADPAKSSVASMYSLASKYAYLRDLAKKEKLSITGDDLTKLAILSWNEDIKVVGDSLSKYKTYEGTWGQYNKNSKHPYALTLEIYEKAFKRNIKQK